MMNNMPIKPIAVVVGTPDHLKTTEKGRQQLKMLKKWSGKPTLLSRLKWRLMGV